MTPKTETIFSDIIQAALDITLNFIDSSFALLTSTASVQHPCNELTSAQWAWRYLKISNQAGPKNENQNTIR